jgi:MOSC domain-containing protein YiiM
MRPGRIVWLGIRRARKAEVEPVDGIVLSPEQGLAGDHYGGRSGQRQVTLIEAEQLAAIAGSLGRDTLPPALTRRNVVLQGVNLQALRGATLSLGEAVLEVTGDCHPCSRMEAVLGPGGYNAMRGRGGMTARVLAGGIVSLNDVVTRL